MTRDEFLIAVATMTPEQRLATAYYGRAAMTTAPARYLDETLKAGIGHDDNEISAGALFRSVFSEEMPVGIRRVRAPTKEDPTSEPPGFGFTCLHVTDSDGNRYGMVTEIDLDGGYIIQIAVDERGNIVVEDGLAKKVRTERPDFRIVARTNGVLLP